MDEIYKQNYMKCLGYIQNAYVLAYTSSLLMLSLNLTANEDKGLKKFPVPFFDVELPRLVGVFATLSLYIFIGFVILFLNGQLSSIKQNISKEMAKALGTYPAVSHTSKLFQGFVVAGLITIFIIMFKSGPKPMDWFDAVGSSVTVSFGYLLSLLPNKWLKQTAKSAAA